MLKYSAWYDIPFFCIHKSFYKPDKSPDQLLHQIHLKETPLIYCTNPLCLLLFAAVRFYLQLFLVWTGLHFGLGDIDLTTEFNIILSKNKYVISRSYLESEMHQAAKKIRHGKSKSTVIPVLFQICLLLS